MDAIYLISRCIVQTMYNLNYRAAALGVQSWREIACEGTQTKEVEHPDTVYLPVLPYQLLIQLMDLHEIRYGRMACLRNAHSTSISRLHGGAGYREERRKLFLKDGRNLKQKGNSRGTGRCQQWAVLARHNITDTSMIRGQFTSLPSQTENGDTNTSSEDTGSFPEINLWILHKH
jgi:hypothetical protein